MSKKHVFNAGPCLLPQVAIEHAREALLDFKGTGVSLISISHRTKEWEETMNETRALWREILNIPDEYETVFLGGGASMQFLYVAMNYLEKKAAYLDTGVWAHKALKEAQGLGDAYAIACSKDKNYSYIPKGFEIPTDLDYLHITTNNTIYGTRWSSLPDTGSVPLVADMSSNILSEVYDVSRFGLIYAGAQKNVAPAGLVIVVVRDDLLGHALPITPKVMDFKTMVEKDSMLNTPNCFGIYVAGLVFRWIRERGGVAALEKVNIEKADLLYGFLDESRLFRGTAERRDRSRMNVTFVTGDPDTDARFVKEAAARGLVNVKGHRIVGGMRASIYNAMPVEGVQALVSFMKEFEARNA